MIDLLVVPFDSAHRGLRMGAGPHALLRAGLEERLTEDGWELSRSELGPGDGFLAEVATAFELHEVLRKAVASSVRDQNLPIALTGNCNTGVIGCLSAHGDEPVGLFWFDAHSDAETPETSTSGFFDGMGFAVALGECWRPKLEALAWSGVDGARCVLVGAREISPAALSLLTRRGVAIVSPGIARTRPAAEALAAAISQLKGEGVTRVHVHVDLDVLDPDLVGPANSYALPGGLTAGQLLDQIRLILDAFALASVSIASYDPYVDTTGAVASVGVDVVALLASGDRAR